MNNSNVDKALKSLRKLRIILYIIIVCNLLVIIFNIHFKQVIVVGSSMEPTFYEGNIKLCEKRPKNIKVGDILGYKSNGISIVHRVHEIHTMGDYTYYIMKGDNNQERDFLPITKENIYCRIVRE